MEHHCVQIVSIVSSTNLTVAFIVVTCCYSAGAASREREGMDAGIHTPYATKVSLMKNKRMHTLPMLGGRSSSSDARCFDPDLFLPEHYRIKLDEYGF